MLPRILAIDDEEMIRETLRLVLENKGYEVEVAENGADGIDLQQKKKFLRCCYHRHFNAYQRRHRNHH